MYKFEIYKNTINPMIGAVYNDSIRYAEELYVFEREINPLWDNLSFTWKKDSGRYFFRKYLDESFTLIGDEFSWANEIRIDDTEKNIYRFLKISEKIDGIWEEQWKGFFSIVDGEFNLLNCSVEFSDIPPFDEYSIIIENIDREVNLIDIPPIPINYNIHTYDYETDVVNETEYFTACSSVTPSFLSVLTGEEFPDESEKWTLVRKDLSYGGQGYHGGVYSWIYDVVFEYRRDITYAAANPDPAKWVLIDATGALNKYARHYKDMDSLSFTHNVYSKSYYVPDVGTYCNFKYATNSVILPNDLEYENERARTLSSVIYHLLYRNSDIVLYESQFFEGSVNPITGITNTLNNLVVLQLSDMKTTSDPATRGMYSFKDIETWLGIFKAGWYIDEYGSFRVEHRKFFDLGLSYTANESDMVISNIDETISYSDDTPQSENLKFAFSSGQDFIGVPIRYYGSVVNRKEDAGTSEHNASNVATDLTFVTSNQDEVGSDGFFMAATTITNNGQLYVLRINGALSGDLIENGYLSVANIMSDYWRWGGSASSGMLNNERVDFTEKNIIIHPDITVSNCSSFNPYKLKTTEIGDGRVEEATLTLNDKKLTLTLSY